MKIFLAITMMMMGAAFCKDISYDDCEESLKPLAKIVKVSVEPCTDYTDSSCSVAEGASNTITIQFTPTTDIAALTTVIHAHLGPLWVPYSLPKGQEDACKTGDVKCPLKAGEDTTYKFSLNVSKGYPKFDLVLRWQLLEGEKNHVCVQFPVRIV